MAHFIHIQSRKMAHNAHMKIFDEIQPLQSNMYGVLKK